MLDSPLREEEVEKSGAKMIEWESWGREKIKLSVAEYFDTSGWYAVLGRRVGKYIDYGGLRS